jgi:hypothetical protein
MTVLARRRAFLACAAGLIGAAALAAALEPGSTTEGARPAARARPMVLANAGASHSASPRRKSGTARTDERDSLAQARRRALAFLRAFLSYQLGDARIRAALARTSSAAVARYLLADPARPSGDAPRPQLRSMRLYARGQAEVKASALLRYGRRQSPFEFILERGRGGWRVVELYP